MSEYNCSKCFTSIGKFYAIRSQELHGRMLCMRCHLKLRAEEHANEVEEDVVLSPCIL